MGIGVWPGGEAGTVQVMSSAWWDETAGMVCGGGWGWPGMAWLQLVKVWRVWRAAATPRCRIKTQTADSQDPLNRVLRLTGSASARCLQPRSVEARHDSIALLEQNTTVTPVCDVGCVSSKACQSLPGI